MATHQQLNMYVAEWSKASILTLPLLSLLALKTEICFYNGDLQLFPGVDQLPLLEVPYPFTNGGQQLRHTSGRCPLHHPSVTYMCTID